MPPPGWRGDAALPLHLLAATNLVLLCTVWAVANPVATRRS